MRLTGDRDNALGVEVLHDGGMVSEASLLLPRQRGGIGEIEGGINNADGLGYMD